MSQFVLPDPNGNVLDEQIEWDSIIESENTCHADSVLEKRPDLTLHLTLLQLEM